MPVSHQDRLDIISRRPQQTEELGAALGRLLRAGDRICLSGELGAGKTAFSRGIGIGWGAVIPLTSPSFNLAHQHQGRDGERLYHLDFYRIRGADEAESMGIDDILEDAAVAIFEWPERIKAILPPGHLWADIRAAGTGERRFVFSAYGRRHQKLLADYRQQVESCCWP